MVGVTAEMAADNTIKTIKLVTIIKKVQLPCQKKLIDRYHLILYNVVNVSNVDDNNKTLLTFKRSKIT